MDLILTSNALPLTNQELASGPILFGAITSAKKPLSERTILVVEDEMLVLMDAEDMLRDLGCRSVIAAASVAQALHSIETLTFDAALVDLNLNGDRSYVVADALAARGVPFAFATGYSASGLREVDLIRPILMKPYREDELARTMTGLLGG